MIGEEYTVTAMCPPPLDFSWSVCFPCQHQMHPPFSTVYHGRWFFSSRPYHALLFHDQMRRLRYSEKPIQMLFLQHEVCLCNFCFLFFVFLLWRSGFYWENLQKQPQFSLIYSSRPLIIVSKTRGLDTEHIDRWFWYSVFWTTKNKKNG